MKAFSRKAGTADLSKESLRAVSCYNPALGLLWVSSAACLNPDTRRYGEAGAASCGWKEGLIQPARRRRPESLRSQPKLKNFPPPEWPWMSEKNQPHIHCSVFRTGR